MNHVGLVPICSFQGGLIYMKSYIGIVIVVLLVSTTIVTANDLAIYSGPSNPDWISAGAVEKNTETVMNDAGVKALFNKIENFGDGDDKGEDSPLCRMV